MTTTNELVIISRVRGEVHGDAAVTGENLFLAWGYPTAIFLFLEFLALIWLQEDWCSWIWIGIPLIGAPLMIYFLNKDYARTHRRTHDQSVILIMWIFIGFASAIGGLSMGLAGVFPQFYCAFQGLLCGLGSSVRRLSAASLPPHYLYCLFSFRVSCGLGSCSSPLAWQSFLSSSQDICSDVMSEELINNSINSES